MGGARKVRSTGSDLDGVLNASTRRGLGKVSCACSGSRRSLRGSAGRAGSVITWSARGQWSTVEGQAHANARPTPPYPRASRSPLRGEVSRAKSGESSPRGSRAHSRRSARCGTGCPVHLDTACDFFAARRLGYEPVQRLATAFRRFLSHVGHLLNCLRGPPFGCLV
jgi:hypothetical protein